MNRTFYVVKGKQARHEYYVGMVPLEALTGLFLGTEEEIYAQRPLNKDRIPEICNYVIKNRDEYVFSALAVSIKGELQYEPIDESASVGVLRAAEGAVFIISDGQHRKEAIIKALEKDETLRHESIPIVFFPDRGPEHQRQMFVDLNKNAVKASNSCAGNFDSRDQLSELTRVVMTKIEFFNKYTDTDRDILGKYSSKLFTFNSLKKANTRLVARHDIHEEDYSFAIAFWQGVVENMKQWKELEEHQITKKELRESFITTQGIVLQAFGIVGNYFLNNPIDDYKSRMKTLGNINWLRNAPQWEGRARDSKGKILTNNTAIKRIAAYIKKEMGLELTSYEVEIERS